jgi:type II secretory ATPase GspE/PulE/Tfp pilus assembly ATPase PilB-like protein
LPAFDGNVPAINGCPECNETGYKWRLAILELLEITEDMRNIVVDKWNESEILTKARANGFVTLTEDGIIKALKGETTMEEIHRVL